MQEKWSARQVEKEIRTIKIVNYTVLGILGALVLLVFIWFASYQYWHTFTKEKWMEYPEQRAGMTADLFENHELLGMTEGGLLALLGQNDNDLGYFEQEGRNVYRLGNERTVIDSEWLLVDFENGVVSKYSIMMD